METSSNDINAIDRARIFSSPSLKLLHGANSIIQADVYSVTLGNTTYLVKDFSKRPSLARRLFCRLILKREYNVLQELQDMEGIPKLFGYLDKDAYIQEYILGPGELQSRRCTPADQLPSTNFFSRLKELVNAMHNHGIAHGDLRRKNILQGLQNNPYLIDFATACHNTRSRLNIFKRLAYRTLKRSDKLAILKLQRSFHPDSLTPEENQQLDNLPWPLRIGRFYRKKIYKHIKPKRWRRRSHSHSNSNSALSSPPRRSR